MMLTIQQLYRGAHYLKHPALETSMIMAKKRIRRLPIQSNGQFEGIVPISGLAPEKELAR